jgi:hypothetical protein
MQGTFSYERDAVAWVVLDLYVEAKVGDGRLAVGLGWLRSVSDIFAAAA